MYAYCEGNPVTYVDSSGHEMVFSRKYKRINVKGGTNLFMLGQKYIGEEQKGENILLIFCNICWK